VATLPRRPSGQVSSEVEPTLVGSRLRAIRLAAGLSQQQVAAAVGVTQGAPSYLERREANPHASTLQGLSRLFGLPERDFGPHGRPIEMVVEEVRTRQRSLDREMGTGLHKALPQVADWGRVGGPVDQFGWTGGFQHVLAHLVEGVDGAFVVEATEDDLAPEIEPGHLVIIRPQQVWEDQRVHLFEHRGRAVLRRVGVSANIIRWREPDGTDELFPTSKVRLFGRAVASQPPGRRL
jgi:transcriptional regulator with XRE-family HTH domain